MTAWFDTAATGTSTNSPKHQEHLDRPRSVLILTGWNAGCSETIRRIACAASAGRIAHGKIDLPHPLRPSAGSEVSKLLLCDVKHRDDMTDARFDGGDQSKDGRKASPRGSYTV